MILQKRSDLGTLFRNPDPTRKVYFGSDQVKKVPDPDSQRKTKGI
jgi:hypothetical protein